MIKKRQFDCPTLDCKTRERLLLQERDGGGSDCDIGLHVLQCVDSDLLLLVTVSSVQDVQSELHAQRDTVLL